MWQNHPTQIHDEGTRRDRNSAKKWRMADTLIHLAITPRLLVTLERTDIYKHYEVRFHQPRREGVRTCVVGRDLETNDFSMRLFS